MRTHSSDGVQRVLDGQQQNLVPAGGVVCVGGSGDPLAGGEVEEGLLLGDTHGLTGSSRHAALGARHAVELHQSLTLERHHYHVTADRAQVCQRRRSVTQVKTGSTSVCSLKVQSEYKSFSLWSQETAAFENKSGSIYI